MRSVLIALNRVPRVGATKVRSLERAFGALTEVVHHSAEEIAVRCKDIGPELAREIVEVLHSDFAQEEEARAASCNVTILTWEDEAYPESLRRLDSPPLCLYCAGNLALLRQAQVAMIGTRRASIYGSEQAQRFALQLAQAGMHVLSGLAEGIDSAAHEGALLAGKEAPGKTIAIIGAALDCVYPATRKPLAREIVRAGGLVVSEYPFGRHADRKTFPQRNRLVAALAKAVFVVESPQKSGTLITVDFAHALNCPVYALPGRCDWSSFAGNHDLLREGKAKLVTSPIHLLEPFDTFRLEESALETRNVEEVPLGLSGDELTLYQAVPPEGASLDELCERTGLPMGSVMSISIGLQMRRKLRSLPGGRVSRVAK